MGSVLALGCVPFILASAMAQNLFPCRADTAWGYCDSLKQVVIPVQYGSASIFSPAGIATVREGSSFGFIDTTGGEVTSIRSERWVYFWSDVCPIWQDGKVGMINSKGEWVLSPDFEDVDFVSSGPIAMRSSTGWSLYSRTGKRLTKWPATNILIRSATLIGVELDGKWGFVDHRGKRVIKPAFQDVHGFDDEGRCAVMRDGSWGFMDRKGKLLFPPKYAVVRGFQEEGAWVKINGKWGLIDTAGGSIIPPCYEEVSYFKEGLAYVKLSGHWGYVDPNGMIAIPFQYEQAFEFSEGLAEVCLNDSACGYIDTQGNIVIPLNYDINFGGEFSEGLAEVRKYELYGFIRKTGEVVIPVQHRTVADYNSFENGIGELLVKEKEGQIEDSDDSRRFFFDRHGTVFLIDR